MNNNSETQHVSSPPFREWLIRYDEVRNQTLKLVEALAPDDQMIQSMPDASPTKWHLAHTTWFFETFILVPHMASYTPWDERFGFLFNSYYKQLGNHPDRTIRGTFSRPTLNEIQNYRSHVDQQIQKLFAVEDCVEILNLLQLGIHHEQQHQELIVTDIKHAFWTNPLRPCYQPRQVRLVEPQGIQPLAWCRFDETLYSAGHDRRGFGYDNELPRHRVYMEPFYLASRLITNEEYLEFIEDGGYTRPEFWLSDGWDHICNTGWTAPLYWEQAKDGWTQFTCRGTMPLNPDEPVCHVSFYEADAFARWRQARLPTEFEWELAASSVEHGSGSLGNLLEGGKYHPAPAGSETQLRQIFGDTWEWTSSPYSAYPGYRPPEGLEGEYNGKFMCNQFVLRGGSCVTPASHIRKSYRNYFPPHARWQFSGIRLACDEATQVGGTKS